MWTSGAFQKSMGDYKGLLNFQEFIMSQRAFHMHVSQTGQMSNVTSILSSWWCSLEWFPPCGETRHLLWWAELQITSEPYEIMDSANMSYVIKIWTPYFVLFIWKSNKLQKKKKKSKSFNRCSEEDVKPDLPEAYTSAVSNRFTPFS